MKNPMIIWKTLAATCVAMCLFAGCSALYRDTRYTYCPDDPQEWTQVDTIGEFGQFTLECTRGGITVRVPGQLTRDSYAEKIGPPFLPVAKTKRATSDSTSKHFVRITIASPRDSCVIDRLRISLVAENDSVVHPVNLVDRWFVVHDTTRVMLLEFRGALFTSGTVRLDLGTFMVGAREVSWPRLTYEKESDTHYNPATFPTD